MKKEYTDKVSLLINTIPHIAKESCFSLKGGTAINLFYLDMPRLSVDIDLTHIKFDDRSTAYMNINKALERISKSLIHIVSSAELYGGKMCAALDRQHPRDMFDLQNILSVADKETDLIKGFLAMMLGHNKPVHELLNTKAKDQTEILKKRNYRNDRYRIFL